MQKREELSLREPSSWQDLLSYFFGESGLKLARAEAEEPRRPRPYVRVPGARVGRRNSVDGSRFRSAHFDVAAKTSALLPFVVIVFVVDVATRRLKFNSMLSKLPLDIFDVHPLCTLQLRTK